jgi:hypothetical protein
VLALISGLPQKGGTDLIDAPETGIEEFDEPQDP